MLEHVCVFHKSGLVLWSQSLKAVSSNVVDQYVQSVLLEQRVAGGAATNSLVLDDYVVKSAVDNVHDFVFVVRPPNPKKARESG
jgi:hypothetical protein